jgi:uncharacterized lipoprotein YddW (UPF0748 family)
VPPGLRVHAWVNVLSLSQNPRAPIIAQVGRDAVLVDRHGRSLLDYPGYEVPAPDRTYYRMGTPGLYLDPAAPGVAEWLVALFGELVARYPGSPGCTSTTSAIPTCCRSCRRALRRRARLRLRRAVARALRRRDGQARAVRVDRSTTPTRGTTGGRASVTALVREIARTARAQRPGIAMSAAVWSHADRAYLALHQDWRAWLEDGLLDFAVPMTYTRDDRLLRYQAEHFAGLPIAKRIWVGLGTWLFARDPERALAQIQIVHDAGLADVSLFSYDSIASEPALRDALRAGVAHGE